MQKIKKSFNKVESMTEHDILVRPFDDFKQNIQMIGQYLKCESAHAVRGVLAFGRSRCFLILSRAFVFLFTDWHIFDMCNSKFNLLSNDISKNFPVSEAVIIILSHLIDIKLFWTFLPKNMIWNFHRFAPRKLISNQCRRSSRSSLSICMTPRTLVSHVYRVLSSAKLQILFTKWIISFIKKNKPLYVHSIHWMYIRLTCMMFSHRITFFLI